MWSEKNSSWVMVPDKNMEEGEYWDTAAINVTPNTISVLFIIKQSLNIWTLTSPPDGHPELVNQCRIFCAGTQKKTFMFPAQMETKRIPFPDKCEYNEGNLDVLLSRKLNQNLNLTGIAQFQPVNQSGSEDIAEHVGLLNIQNTTTWSDQNIEQQMKEYPFSVIDFDATYNVEQFTNLKYQIELEDNPHGKTSTELFYKEAENRWFCELHEYMEMTFDGSHLCLTFLNQGKVTGFKCLGAPIQTELGDPKDVVLFCKYDESKCLEFKVGQDFGTAKDPKWKYFNFRFDHMTHRIKLLTGFYDKIFDPYFEQTIHAPSCPLTYFGNHFYIMSKQGKGIQNSLMGSPNVIFRMNGFLKENTPLIVKSVRKWERDEIVCDRDSLTEFDLQLVDRWYVPLKIKRPVLITIKMCPLPEEYPW
jgi:hypothetical protein